MAVKDELDLASENEAPTDTRQILKEQFQSGDASQVLLLFIKFHHMRMQDSGNVEENIRQARELKNNLSTLGQPVENSTVVQLMLAGLPRSYKGFIQSLSMLDRLSTFTV